MPFLILNQSGEGTLNCLDFLSAENLAQQFQLRNNVLTFPPNWARACVVREIGQKGACSPVVAGAVHAGILRHCHLAKGVRVTDGARALKCWR